MVNAEFACGNILPSTRLAVLSLSQGSLQQTVEAAECLKCCVALSLTLQRLALTSNDTN